MLVSINGRSHPTLLPRDPAHQCGFPGAEYRAQSEDGKPRAFGKVIDLSPAALSPNMKVAISSAPRRRSSASSVDNGVWFGSACGSMSISPSCCRFAGR
jgi:hypothetical protein